MSEKRLTALKAIRAKCIDCMCGSMNEVRLCPSTDCPLYVFRLGKNPNIKLTDEQKAAKAANLRKSLALHGYEKARDVSDDNSISQS